MGTICCEGILGVGWGGGRGEEGVKLGVLSAVARELYNLVEMLTYSVILASPRESAFMEGKLVNKYKQIRTFQDIMTTLKNELCTRYVDGKIVEQTQKCLAVEGGGGLLSMRRDYTWRL